jgi:four helix bundle protein
MYSLKEIQAYTEAMALNRTSFPTICGIRQPSYRDQLLRCSLSIPSNIAEGYYRNTPGDFVRHLRYARGSAGEFITQMELAIDNQMVEREIGLRFISDADRISAKLFRLIQHIESSKK